ncbi:hypothetical protein F5B22DRAFT_643933 [Xylaria bambusicola]|uniref:uncharacterized protein n=1 Tax=Xylaria bambusicola TaxID=326684 RepID=UPI002008374C|nr:uncharacterized protein F5B22DRAFT_643933 [Xylaria bambusicola]KAI0521205.1 hypothetical protein F5B22DRAFT_643933 [Xylaria bambusicola]
MTSEGDAKATMDQGYPVHIGAWTNWSRGSIMGATVTLTRQDAALVIAFTSTFLAFIATRVWRLFCFALHRYYSAMGPQDATYHQMQAILRNAAAPEDGIRLFLKLLSMKHRRTKRYHQLLFSVTSGIILLISFTVLGGFSSSIATSDNEVLIQSAGCGYLYSDNNYFFERRSYSGKKINNAANYALQCYSNQDSQFDCDRFVMDRITGNVDLNATCPFDNTICLNQRGNIHIDSGFINSHLHLGFNAPTKERILWRNVLHCAPLTTAGFTSVDTKTQPNEAVFHYGNITTHTGKADYIFRIPDLDSQYRNSLSDAVLLTDVNYKVNSLVAEVKNRSIYEINSDYMPIDALIRADADIHLVFLAGNGVVFSEHTDDAWYNVSATTTEVPIVLAGEPDTEQVYFPNAPASPLGCASQHQFCITDHPDSCGPLASLRDAIAGAAPLFDTTYAEIANNTATSEKAARFTYFANPFFAVDRDVSGILGQLGSRALLSQQNMFAGFQGPLASNQWQLDVSHWWDISMAVAQSIYIDSAYGLSDPVLEQSRKNYTESYFNNVCHNQKIKSTAYTSLSIFGLVFTYLVGFLLALVSYLVEPVSAWLHKRRSYGQYKHLEWTTNATLQLQRLAHEGIGQGTWSKGAETVPVTKEGESLALLDISNQEHPVLRPLIVGNQQDSPSYNSCSKDGMGARSERSSR